MKTKLLLGATIALFSLYSCDEIGTVNVETTLQKTITAEVEKPVQGIASGSKIASANFVFNESDTLNLADNSDLKEYIDNIKEFDIYVVSCKLNGIPTGETVEELTISAPDAGMSITLNNLTENNSLIDLNISNDILKVIGTKLLNYKKLVLTVSGTTTYAPMTLSISLNFETNVKTNVL